MDSVGVATVTNRSRGVVDCLGGSGCHIQEVPDQRLRSARGSRPLGSVDEVQSSGQLSSVTLAATVSEARFSTMIS
jgi:hypothetical protein